MFLQLPQPSSSAHAPFMLGVLQRNATGCSDVGVRPVDSFKFTMVKSRLDHVEFIGFFVYQMPCNILIFFLFAIAIPMKTYKYSSAFIYIYLETIQSSANNLPIEKKQQKIYGKTVDQMRGLTFFKFLSHILLMFIIVKVEDDQSMMILIACQHQYFPLFSPPLICIVPMEIQPVHGFQPLTVSVTEADWTPVFLTNGSAPFPFCCPTASSSLPIDGTFTLMKFPLTCVSHVWVYFHCC